VRPEYTIRRHTALEEIGPELWDDLAARSSEATYFQGFAWNESWWNARRDADHTLAILSAWRDGRLVGLAPLQLGEIDVRIGRALSFIGQGNSDYQDFLVDRSEPAVVDALLAAIAGLDERWERFLAYELPEGSLLRAALQEAHRVDRFRLERKDDTLCPYFDIVRDPEGFAALAEKQRFKRQTGQLARLGRVTIEHLLDPDAIASELPGFFRQHAERWAITRTPSLFLDPAARSLYESLVRIGGRRGEILLSVLRLDGRAVAHHFGFLHRNRLLWYKPSYDLRLFRVAPGNAILQATIRFAVERGLHELDFTRGDEAYKARFTNAQRRSANWTWYRSAAIQARGAAMRALRARLRRLIEPIRSDEAESASHAVKLALAAGRRFLVDIDRVAWCTVSGPTPTAARELDLAWFFEGADLTPRSAWTEILTEAYRRIHARQRCMAPTDPDPPRAAAWIDETGRISGVMALTPQADREHYAFALRAAAAVHAEGGAPIAVVLGDGISRELLRRAGFSIESIDTDARVLGIRRRGVEGARR
jgi:CelD/BcsL family acetyltransferase involved in cellulose biosynthesis